MGPRPHNRRAFVLNSLAGDELQGGKPDIATMFSVLTDGKYGMCHRKKSELIPDCEDPPQFEARLIDFLEKWEDTPGVMLFYYSGHGVTSSDKFYFKFGEKTRDLYPFDNLIGQVCKFRFNSAAFILDACHSGAAAESAGLKGGETTSEDIGIPEDVPEGFVILTSCTKRQKSREGARDSFGIFTKLFCECIKTGVGHTVTANNVICAQDIVTYIEKQLKSDEYKGYNQTPTLDIRGGRGTFWIAKNITKPTDIIQTSHSVPDNVVEDHLLNRPTRVAEFDEEEVAAYRKSLRPDVRRRTLKKTDREFWRTWDFLTVDI